jgi:hypothetical protein
MRPTVGSSQNFQNGAVSKQLTYDGGGGGGIRGVWGVSESVDMKRGVHSPSEHPTAIPSFISVFISLFQILQPPNHGYSAVTVL